MGSKGCEKDGRYLGRCLNLQSPSHRSPGPSRMGSVLRVVCTLRRRVGRAMIVSESSGAIWPVRFETKPV